MFCNFTGVLSFVVGETCGTITTDSDVGLVLTDFVFGATTATVVEGDFKLGDTVIGCGTVSNPSGFSSQRGVPGLSSQSSVLWRRDECDDEDPPPTEEDEDDCLAEESLLAKRFRGRFSRS